MDKQLKEPEFQKIRHFNVHVRKQNKYLIFRRS
jgi:hypothetical protein